MQKQFYTARGPKECTKCGVTQPLANFRKASRRSGPRARGIAMTLYPLLSPKRQREIRAALLP